MKIARISCVLLVFLCNACLYNSLEEVLLVDCSSSTLDFASFTVNADCGLSNGSIEIVVFGGEPPYMYLLDNEPQPTAMFNNLPQGNYSITVIDSTTCSTMKEVLIAVVSGFQTTASVTYSGCKSADGTISVQASNGIEPYTYHLKNGADQSTPIFSNLEAGQYEVITTDATGCSISLIKNILTGISFSTSVKPIIANSCAVTGCHDGSSAQANFTIFSNVQSRASSIKSRTQSGSMPKNGTLTQAEKDAIACWVDDGAKNN